MEGGTKSKGELATDAGVIPRAVRQIFDTLEAQKADYSVKVSFLELYNEEITDLLAPDESTRFGEERQRRTISLMEDGKGGVFVRGLEEEVVYSANDIYSLLERGSAKRCTADTLLNKQSSRSHSIFSITVHVREATIGGEELIKCGKLNLVDLAGSENILRSGAREGRAREAGEINKSLLTLGRVITALVEHSGHIPYRDSKLTRLLRESLGGKTKTCIIATVSPSAHCLEETLSTLDYAYRAKNIRNKPEVNQKLSKSVLLKDLYLEIERMKQDVRAAREKNGVYIPHERFVQNEAEKKMMNERVESLENELEQWKKKANRFEEFYDAEKEQTLNLRSDIKQCRENLENVNRAFQELQENHQMIKSEVKEKEFIISKLLCSENSLLEQTKELRTNLETASEDLNTLLSKLDCKTKLEGENHELVLKFRFQLDQNLRNLHKIVIESVSQQNQHFKYMEKCISSFLASKCEATKNLESRIGKIKDSYSSGVAIMKDFACSLQQKASQNLEHMETTFYAQALTIENFLVTAVSEAEHVLHDIQGSLSEHKQLLSFSTKQQEEGLQRNLVSTLVISKTTIDFFNDFHSRASRLMEILEENHRERSCQIASFEKKFKDDSVREEKEALERITTILANLTARKTNMVSEALKNMSDVNIEDKRKLEQEMFSIQKVSEDAKKEWNSYIGKVESQIQEDTFSMAGARGTMEHILQDCSKKVDDSRQQWKNIQLVVGHINNNSTTEITTYVEQCISANSTALEEIMSTSMSADEKFSDRASDLFVGVNNSLSLDNKAKEELESLMGMSVKHFNRMQDHHNENISDIRNHTERCFKTDYKVYQPTCTTPKKQGIIVPSLESIEGSKAPPFDEIVTIMRSENRSNERISEGKAVRELLPDELSGTPRSPLTEVN
ncbi:hypothetical protein QJS10_CPB20g00946 [Acorus calamus]|uniref:Kinesin-like protein n=1 Tax=Acorus calamus TaxID=4465 RepID=A0AAV9CB65_ACOCL|nr:hypothetical protein QJS10_CPB20g00946 [Acorus calamus]